MFEASSQGKKESLLARYASNTIVEKMEKKRLFAAWKSL
jgi:hypothetical protein